ncbi:MAG: purine phosphorylase [Sphingomonadaceae bacterium]
MAVFNRIGIVAGVAFELDMFQPGKGETIELAGLGVRSLSHAGKTILLACEGIGKVAAATAASVLAVAGKVDLLFVIGTAGKIGAREEKLFKIVTAVEADYGARQEDRFVHYPAGSLPIGPSKLHYFQAMPTPLLHLPAARVATSDSFVEAASHAAYLRETFSADLVDMETAAVAHVAARHRLPWCAIKATTDEANAESAVSFHANLTAAARSAAAAAEDFIALI